MNKKQQHKETLVDTQLERAFLASLFINAYATEYMHKMQGVVLVDDFTTDEDGSAAFRGSPEAYRGLFLIDKSGIVRHQVVNDMPLGRSVDEVLRVIDALQFTEEHGEVCPADWHKGDKGLSATQEGIADYLSEK